MKKEASVDTQTDTTTETQTAVSAIRVDRPTRRKMSTRGLEQLAASMAVEGLRHPILVTPNGNVLKGRRRLAAARKLGWTTIQTREVRYLEDAVGLIIDSRDELCEPRLVEDWVALGMAIESLDHRVTGLKDRYQELAGAAVTTSGSRYKRARAVVVAAHSPGRPAHVVEVAKQAITALDAGEITATGAYRRLKAAEKANPANVVDDDGLPTTAPPSPLARSPRARLLRAEWVRALAAQGATSHQMADRLGITVTAIRRIVSDMSIAVPADQVLANTQRKAADPNRSMRVAIDDLDALVWSLSRIDLTQLDTTEAARWAADLARYARAINHVSRTIKGVVQ